MPTIHTVKQGENIERIAAKYKLGDWRDIYEHSENKAFKKSNPNPDVITPGDKIIIPDVIPKSLYAVPTGKMHSFVLKKKMQKLKIKLQIDEDESFENASAVLTVDGQIIEAPIQNNGLLEMDIPNVKSKKGRLDVYKDENSEDPDYTYNIGLSELDPVEGTSGVQARLNALGFDCGNVDGQIGPLTEESVKLFQEENQLEVDGIAGPVTKKKLKEKYGC